MKLLVVEDERGLRDSMRDYLAEAGNICETASDYGSALQKINLYRYDCVILDITLPGGNGLNVLQAIKEQNYPDGVLIVSAKNSLSDRLAGLNFGADDYLTKPFHLSELMARVSAIVRRRTFNGAQRVDFREIHVDLVAMQTYVFETPIKLTKKEYALLLYLIANKGKIVSKNAVAEHLWGDDVDMSDNFDFIYSHIKNLRKKLMDAGSRDYIQSAYGMGYKFTDV